MKLYNWLPANERVLQNTEYRFLAEVPPARQYRIYVPFVTDVPLYQNWVLEYMCLRVGDEWKRLRMATESEIIVRMQKGRPHIYRYDLYNEYSGTLLLAQLHILQVVGENTKFMAGSYMRIIC